MSARYVVRGTGRRADRPGLQVYAFRHFSLAPPGIMCAAAHDLPPADVGTIHFETRTDAIVASRQLGHLDDVTIFAVAEDGTETPLPSYEDALAESERAHTAIDSLEKLLAGMVERPRMYATTAEALELQALLAMDTRRILLGMERDRRPRPSGKPGVYERLMLERFGETSFRACHAIEQLFEMMDDRERNERAVTEMAAFVGEWWKREQEATRR